jgi:hypothetical protein
MSGDDRALAAGTSAEGPRSFFVSTFTRSDWIGLAAATAGFLGILYLIMENVATAHVAEVKTEIALVKDSVADAQTNLTAAFDAHAEAVNRSIEGALEQRTDEIARSLVAMFGDGNAVIVRVANVPMSDPTVMTAVQNFTTEFAAGTHLATFGDKAVVETVVHGMVNEKARSLQGMIESLSGYPSVQTDIMLADRDKIGALRAKFLEEQSGQN